MKPTQKADPSRETSQLDSPDADGAGQLWERDRGEEVPAELDQAPQIGEGLRAATAPRELPRARHEAILAAVLGDSWEDGDLEGDEVACVDDAERAAAEGLARALAENAHHPLFAWISALKSAYDPKGLDPLSLERLSARALRQRTVERSVYALGLFAAAATVLFAIQWASRPPREGLGADLRRPTSTQQYFVPEDFSMEVPASERADRMADRRHEDLRNNRFAQWGIR